jgi:hypothetical protein
MDLGQICDLVEHEASEATTWRPSRDRILGASLTVLGSVTGAFRYPMGSIIMLGFRDLAGVVRTTGWP